MLALLQDRTCAISAADLKWRLATVPQDTRPWGRNYEPDPNAPAQPEAPKGTGWVLDASALQQLEEADMIAGAAALANEKR